jgi:trans-aconitate 2-methyltransferase
MANWDAGLYLKFADERTRPAADLAARIALAAPARVVDLGCGPGNSTAVLRTRWPAADVVGVDNSPDMIAAATKAHPGGRWVLADLATWADPEPFDVVFSNAALQWVPGHAAVIPRLFALVAPGGALAVQAPIHFESPLHRLMLQIADRPEWRDRMAAAKAALRTERPGFYYDALRPAAAKLDLWVTEYLHELPGPADIVAWIRGTGLRPYLAALAGDTERSAFERLLLEGVTAAYPPQADGRVLFPFRRLFVIAYRAG